MSTDRDTTRIVRSWMEEGATKVPERVLDAVLDQLPMTHQRRAAWPARRLSMFTSNLFRVGIAAAVVLGLAFVGLNVFGGGRGFGGDPPATETQASPSPTPVPSGGGAFPVTGEMHPGTYTISDPFPVDIELTLAETWFPWTPGVGEDVAAIFQVSADPPDGRVIIIGVVDEVFADPCETNGVLEAVPGPAAADLADVLASQPFTESTEPVEVTISGYSGVYIDYTNTGGCGRLRRWQSEFGNREALAGERDQVWILDVEGVRLVIDAASFADTPEEDLAEMRTIIESMVIEP